MARAPQSDRLFLRVLSCALIVLFGLAPFSPLLALASEPECRMACCERKHAAHSCPLHPKPDSGSTPIHFEASNSCLPNCSCAGIAPSMAGQTAVPDQAAAEIPTVESGKIHNFGSPVTRWTLDPTLYQRPPPLVKRFLTQITVL